MFKAHLLAPDLFGPFRQPRAGSSDRTGLGMDQTEVTLTGTSTASNVFGIQGASAYVTGSNFSWGPLAGTGTAIAGGTINGPSVQFPAAGNMADCNLTACSIVAYYTGAPGTVQGEVIFGSAIPLAAGATYSSLYYYPGVIRMPVAQLISQPLRVSMRKLSPVADEFVGTSAGNADVDMPFVFVTGLPNGGTLNVLITRTWEYRSTTTAGNVVTYEKVGPSHSSDFMALMDAKGDVADMASTVTPAMPEAAGKTDYLSRIGFGNVSNLAKVGAASALSFIAQRQLARVISGRAQTGLPFDAYAGIV